MHIYVLYNRCSKCEPKLFLHSSFFTKFFPNGQGISQLPGYEHRENRLPERWLPAAGSAGSHREWVFIEEAGNQLRPNQCFELSGGVEGVNVESSSSDEDYLLLNSFHTTVKKETKENACH